MKLSAVESQERVVRIRKAIKPLAHEGRFVLVWRPVLRPKNLLIWKEFHIFHVSL
jgi:hypothetical protein